MFTFSLARLLFLLSMSSFVGGCVAMTVNHWTGGC